jgi:hypothetical protein
MVHKTNMRLKMLIGVRRYTLSYTSMITLPSIQNISAWISLNKQSLCVFLIVEPSILYKACPSESGTGVGAPLFPAVELCDFSGRWQCMSWEIWYTVDPRVTTGLTNEQLGLRSKIILVLTYDQILSYDPHADQGYLSCDPAWRS